MLTNELSNRAHFDMTSDQMIGVVRSFRRLSDALEEVKNARIFAGIHFRTACEDGTTLGAAVAQFAFRPHLRSAVTAAWPAAFRAPPVAIRYRPLSVDNLTFLRLDGGVHYSARSPFAEGEFSMESL